MDQQKCQSATCPNNGGYCFVADGKIHLRLFPANLRAWSVAINEEQATLECPTEALLKALAPVRQGQRNPFRVSENPKPISTLKSQNKLNISHTTHIPPHFSDYPLPYPPHVYPYYPPYSLPSPYPLPKTSYYNRYHDDDRDVKDVRSSPTIDPIDDGDPVVRLAKYLDWLGRVSPRQAESIDVAKEKLIEQGYSMRTLMQISDEAFKGMDIAPGLVLLFKTEITSFKRLEKQGKI